MRGGWIRGCLGRVGRWGGGGRVVGGGERGGDMKG